MVAFEARQLSLGIVLSVPYGFLILLRARSGAKRFRRQIIAGFSPTFSQVPPVTPPASYASSARGVA